jgi:hypothetical protein
MNATKIPFRFFKKLEYSESSRRTFLSASLVSTSLAHSGGDEDSEDSGIISLFFLATSYQPQVVVDTASGR